MSNTLMLHYPDIASEVSCTLCDILVSLCWIKSSNSSLNIMLGATTNNKCVNPVINVALMLLNVYLLHIPNINFRHNENASSCVFELLNFFYKANRCIKGFVGKKTNEKGKSWGGGGGGSRVEFAGIDYNSLS